MGQWITCQWVSVAHVGASVVGGLVMCLTCRWVGEQLLVVVVGDSVVRCLKPGVSLVSCTYGKTFKKIGKCI